MYIHIFQTPISQGHLGSPLIISNTSILNLCDSYPCYLWIKLFIFDLHLVIYTMFILLLKISLSYNHNIPYKTTLSIVHCKEDKRLKHDISKYSKSEKEKRKEKKRNRVIKWYLIPKSWSEQTLQKYHWIDRQIRMNGNYISRKISWNVSALSLDYR